MLLTKERLSITGFVNFLNAFPELSPLSVVEKEYAATRNLRRRRKRRRLEFLLHA